MSEQDDFYRRKEDQEWHDRITERIVALTSAETVQDGRLDDLEQSLREHFETLHGRSGDKDDAGIVGDIQDLTRSINGLKALMQPDMLGNGGVLSRLKALEKREEREIGDRRDKWKFWTAIVLLILTNVGFLIREWPSIQERWASNVLEFEVANKKAIRNRPKHKKRVIETPEVRPNAGEDMQN